MGNCLCPCYILRVEGCGLKSNPIHIIIPTSQLDEELSGQDSVYICYLLRLIVCRVRYIQ